MKCPKCFNNASDAEKRCGKCGASLIFAMTADVHKSKPITNHILFYDGKRHLRLAGEKEIAAKNLSDEKKIDINEARQVIDLCYSHNLKEYLKQGFLYLFGGIALFSLALIIMLTTGRLYYIILGIGALIAFQGIWKLLSARGVR